MNLFCYMAALTAMYGVALTSFGGGSISEQVFTERGGGSAEAKDAAHPPDIYPDSLSRLPLIKREEIDEQGKKYYDAYVKSRGGNRPREFQGPGGIMLHSPRLSEVNGPLTDYLANGTDFGGRLTQLAVLVTAREMNSQYEWVQHERAARREGLEPEIIDAVRYRKSPAGLGEKESVILSFGRELFRERKVSSQTFARAVKVFGKKGVVDLTSIMGHYASTALFLRAFDMQLHEGEKPQLPMP